MRNVARIVNTLNILKVTEKEYTASVCKHCMYEFKTVDEKNSHIYRFHAQKKSKGNLMVNIGNKEGKKMLVMALADTRAGRTMISKRLSKELNLKLKPTDISLKNVFIGKT